MIWWNALDHRAASRAALETRMFPPRRSDANGRSQPMIPLYTHWKHVVCCCFGSASSSVGT
ncbi:hypothetical protein GZH46_01408 [Fragariocoptes setiger]|uniref:Uncharacterized protein n=1 Tax=Fragariocoptes setiger TaxID=1670756 RepID=A0ABQ7S9M5_9ACAR|nr:hypothetical protein GZH46_01408 [Fragariocoptes setiger]